ncbi:MAG: CoA transferase, partial [Candidatus Thermoplasmatota archaeon]|nr:CoA transferase [Candidatus Thermoplasmatota archaeon]
TSKISIGDLMNQLEKMNIAFAVLNKPSDMLNDPQASAKMVTETYENRTIRVPVTPTGGIMRGNPPGLGENTDEILQNLGYSPDEIHELRKKGVV